MDGTLDDSRADGVSGEAGGVVDAKLVREIHAMMFDGLDADAKFGGCCLVGVAFGDHLEHLYLARSETGVARTLYSSWSEAMSSSR